jgi:hypothetical protein
MSSIHAEPPHDDRRRERRTRKDAPFEPDDVQVGGWPRDELIAMDQRFVARVTWAIARGLERPQGKFQTSRRREVLAWDQHREFSLRGAR